MSDRKCWKGKQKRRLSGRRAATEAAANMVAEKQMEAHEAAMAAHLAQQPMAATLAAGATRYEAITAGQATSRHFSPHAGLNKKAASTFNNNNAGPARRPNLEWKWRPEGNNI